MNRFFNQQIFPLGERVRNCMWDNKTRLCLFCNVKNIKQDKSFSSDIKTSGGQLG